MKDGDKRGTQRRDKPRKKKGGVGGDDAGGGDEGHSDASAETSTPKTMPTTATAAHLKNPNLRISTLKKLLSFDRPHLSLPRQMEEVGENTRLDPLVRHDMEHGREENCAEKCEIEQTGREENCVCREV